LIGCLFPEGHKSGLNWRRFNDKPKLVKMREYLKAKSLKRLDLFGRPFRLELNNRYKTGTYFGFAASILFVIVMLVVALPEIQKVTSLAIDQTSYSTIFYEESMLPDFNTEDIRQYVAFEIEGEFGDDNVWEYVRYSVWLMDDNEEKDLKVFRCANYDGQNQFFNDMKE
jgi:hypothetical protein